MEAYERGQTAWPGVQLPRDVFEAHLQALEATTDHAEDLYLACACARGDAVALRLFDEKMLVHVADFIARIDPSPTVADEVKQLLRAQLLVGRDGQPPGIARYSGRGGLGGWIRIIAVRQAHHLRRRKMDRVQSDDAALVERLAHGGASPELALIRARYRDEFATAVRVAMGRLNERDRVLFKMYVLDGMTIDEVGAFYDVHRSTAARWLVGIKQQLLDHAIEHVKQRLGVDTGEAASLCALVRSQIELSMTGLVDP